MTCIAFDGKTLAADKRAVLAGCGSGTVTKIHRVNGALCAFSGDFDVGMQMVEWYRAGASKADFPKRQADDNAANFLVITPEREIIMYERTPVPLRFEGLRKAMGSGRDYALAAMHLGASAYEAVRVACVYDVGCGNGIDTLTLGGD